MDERLQSKYKWINSCAEEDRVKRPNTGRLFTLALAGTSSGHSNYDGSRGGSQVRE